MPAEDNAALVAKFLDELWNQRNLSIIDQLTVENYIIHLPLGTLEGQDVQQMAAYYFQSFSDIHVTLDLEKQISQGNWVITPVTWDIRVSLRNQAIQQEIERKISATGVAIDRIENGRIVESRNTLDVLYWLHNIQLLSREPSFVELLPGLRTCPPPCSGTRRCIHGFCVTPPPNFTE